MCNLLLLLITCWCASALAKSVLYFAPEDAHIHFEGFITEYNKEYADENEKEARFEIFKKNLEKVNSLNEKNEGVEHGITQFMDLTLEEFKAKYTGLRREDFKPCDVVKYDKDIPDAGAPDSFDWREKNAVTPVKNQSDCGSCYAFSAIGHLESQYFLVKKQPLTEFSEQQIVDCDKLNNGCGGGFISNVFRSLVMLGGPMKQADYPYEAAMKSCRSNKAKVIPKVQSCITYDLHKQESLKQLLYKVGPIAIAIDSSALISYKSGIIPDQITAAPDHAVLLVGYGTEGDKPYWIVKNSYGISYGEKGYFRMQRSDNKNGACGMMNAFMATAVLA